MGRYFLNGMQNGSKLEIWPWGILIHTLELKLRHFDVSPYACIGKPCICNVFRPHATWGAGLRAHINVTTFTNFWQNWSLGCLLALYGSILCIQLDYTVVSGQFFFCLVCGPLEKKTTFKNRKKIRALGSISGRNFDMGTQNGSKQEV